jgi:hypothetical protein
MRIKSITPNACLFCSINQMELKWVADWQPNLLTASTFVFATLWMKILQRLILNIFCSPPKIMRDSPPLPTCHPLSSVSHLVFHVYIRIYVVLGFLGFEEDLLVRIWRRFGISCQFHHQMWWMRNDVWVLAEWWRPDDGINRQFRNVVRLTKKNSASQYRRTEYNSFIATKALNRRIYVVEKSPLWYEVL